MIQNKLDSLIMSKVFIYTTVVVITIIITIKDFYLKKVSLRLVDYFDPAIVDYFHPACRP